MILTTFTFAVQDSFSRLLASEYNVFLIVAIRYFVFATFIVVASFREPQKFKRALKTKYPLLQISRGILLVAEVCIMVFFFTILGLAKVTHFSCYPLMVCLLSIPILNEKIGFFRAIIVLFGLFGTLIILRPGTADFSVEYLIP